MSANAQHQLAQASPVMGHFLKEIPSAKHGQKAAIGRSVGRHQHELKELSWQT